MAEEKRTTSESEVQTPTFPYIFRWDRKGRKGQRCRMVVRSHAMNSCHLVFEDGYEMVTSRNSVVRAANSKNSVAVERKSKTYASLLDEDVSVQARR